MEEIKNKKVDLNKFKSRNNLTIFSLFLAGFLIFWFFLSGSITDNRFGTHLVMAGDLTSVPMWYGLIIAYFSFGLIILSCVLFYLNFKDKLSLTSEQEKIIRIGSLFLIGSATFFIALSSMSFAVFNNSFFSSILEGKYVQRSFVPSWGSKFDLTSSEVTYHLKDSVAFSLQGIIIASFSIVALIAIVATSVVFYVQKFRISDKMYISLRNSAIFLISFTWLIFNINLFAFGSMGGDAGILVNGVLGTDINWEEFGIEMAKFGEGDAQTFYETILQPALGTPGWLLAKPFFEPFWKTGVLNIPGVVDINLGVGLNEILVEVGFWLSILNKPSLLQGVNQSSSAILLMAILISLFFFTFTYVYLDYKFVKNNDTALLYYFSIYIIIIITALYGILAWTVPYIITTSESFNPIVDGLINGEHNGLAPGLIGQAGQPGGINGAIVYFSPKYHGTFVWWLSFVLALLTPLMALFLIIFNPLNSSRRLNLQNNKIKE